jgi:hypothetical protein
MARRGREAAEGVHSWEEEEDKTSRWALYALNELCLPLEWSARAGVMSNCSCTVRSKMGRQFHICHLTVTLPTACKETVPVLQCSHESMTVIQDM